MIRLAMLTVLGALAVTAALAADLATAEGAGSGCIQIVYVIDGDTVIVRDCNTREQFRIRFANVNAPELDAAGGEAARQNLQALLPVGRFAAFRWNGAMSYGRYVGVIHIRTSNGTRNVNDAMNSFLADTPSANAPARVSDPSCAFTATGWVTVGPCYRESYGYQARYDADNDGISCEHGCRFYRRSSSAATANSYAPSSSSSSGGRWVTIGPCYRGQACYSPRGDGDNDGISCERGCRVWRPK